MRTPTGVIPYPRRRVRRAAMRYAGRALLPLLARIQVTGRDHFPPHGPLLVVGNHVAAVEVALMIAYSPWQIEVLGAGDIPPPPLLDAIARTYGYTPINRGNVDREPLLNTLSVLKSGGRVGLFPEGGIWDPGAMSAKRGVAWLSYRAQAPVLPIGFGGLEGALDAMLRLRRPRLTMNVGRVMPPVSIPAGKPRKRALQEAAAQIMRAVDDLVPEETHAEHAQIEGERFELQIVFLEGDVPRPTDQDGIPHADALCKMLYRPAILRIFARDLHLDVSALQQLDTERDPLRIASAATAILGYLESRNPGFFDYRFGHADGQAMEAGLRELRELALRVAEQGLQIALTPIRRYRLAGQEEEILESSPHEAPTW
ncbi:MAG: 1-acyl-sn-glycerol-3-phosphate acyltransferase [Anaerolineae bacterium]|nr:1-acyl-sn-glycerol-3-phosphate acyltransferase [Anaerolineae bacterium]